MLANEARKLRKRVWALKAAARAMVLKGKKFATTTSKQKKVDVDAEVE